MDVKNAPLVISRASLIDKVWDEENQKKIKLAIEKSSNDEDKKDLIELLPTSKEKNWMRFYKSNSPELMRHIKKMSVCFDVEVIKATGDFISFIYGEFKIEIKSPENVYNIFLALDESELEGFEAFVKTESITVNGKVFKLDDNFSIDVLTTIKKIIRKFFFLI